MRIIKKTWNNRIKTTPQEREIIKNVINTETSSSTDEFNHSSEKSVALGNTDLSEDPFYRMFGLTEEQLDYSNFEIDSFECSVRLSNCLRRSEISTWYELLKKTPSEVKNIRNFGAKCYDELLKRVEELTTTIKNNCNSNKVDEAGESDTTSGGRTELIKPHGFSVLPLPETSIGYQQCIVPEYFLDTAIAEYYPGFNSDDRAYFARHGVFECAGLLAMPFDSNIPSGIKKNIMRCAEKMEEVTDVIPLMNLYSLEERTVSILDDDDLNNVTVRLNNCLHRSSIKTWETLMSRTPMELKGIRNMGAKSYKELFLLIRDKMHLIEEYGILESDDVVQKRVEELLESVPAKRRNTNVLGQIEAFTSDEEIRDKLLDRFLDSGTHSFDNILIKPEALDPITKQFLTWCRYDLESEIQELFDSYDKNDKSYIILKERAEKKTLQAIAEEQDVTRERIRQIEKRESAYILSKMREKKILNKIYAERNRDEVLTPEELSGYFGEYSQILLNILRTNKTPKYYYYDKNADVFVIENETLSDQVQTYLDELPDHFTKDELTAIIETACINYDINPEMLEISISKEFALTGNVYHRHRLSLTSIYKSIVEKYYPMGIQVYDSKEIGEFREHILEDYGVIELPEQDRAIGAAITRFSILCGRGKYRLKQDNYLSDELKSAIKRYIEDSKQNIIFIKSIFYAFENALTKEGVNNHYYLQGILHEEFSEAYSFRKDYLFKGSTDYSMSREIANAIRNKGGLVSKEQIKRMFPGVSDITIIFAVSNKDILNYFGEYIHVNNVFITPAEKLTLRREIDYELSRIEFFNIRSLYERVSEQHSTVLLKASVFNPYSLFSLLEYLFADDYEFERPFIGKAGREMGTNEALIGEYVYKDDVVKVDDILAYAKEHGMVIQNILEMLNAYNQDYLLIDKSKLGTESYIGLNQEIVDEVLSIIEREVSKPIRIRDLECIYTLPKLAVPWSDWLIYSIIKKYSEILTVKPSYHQFRYAIPLVKRTNEEWNSDLDTNELVTDSGVVFGDLDMDSIVIDYLDDLYDEEF